MPSKTKKLLISDYNLDATLSSGQSFRWQKLGEDWEGIIGQQWVRLRLDHRYIIAEAASPQHNWEWLKKYLQLDFNLNQAIQTFLDDKPIQNALNATPGLRLLRQDYWETLAAFILSATIKVNNNRIYNDDKYEYDDIGFPFLAELGREIIKIVQAK